ncbi:MAG: hypothetical protein CMN60_15940 [Sphingobium sp.]|jgi:hypothetical protein|nr:hypothetical protein [Sphingobium sp.]|tara:strand:+ start:1202 stop:1405 length:204 start_codon:yes stop_codon:yes gene_type:complete
MPVSLPAGALLAFLVESLGIPSLRPAAWPLVTLGKTAARALSAMATVTFFTCALFFTRYGGFARTLR